MRPDPTLTALRWSVLVAALLGLCARAEAAPVRDVCAALLTAWQPDAKPDRPARLETCARLSRLADAAGTDAALVLAVGFHETHYGADDSGAVRGALQIAACHCPHRTFVGCDLELHGVRALARLLSESEGSETVALRRWLVGPRGRRGELDAGRERWIRAVRATRDAIERALARGEGEV